jgi:CII-binding regulator of phage lambda lysogenization HflD
MSHEELTAALQTLHDELAESDSLDEEDVAHLRATMKQIEDMLEKKAGSTESITGRVTSTAKRFEQSHPVLTNSLGRIADILQQMGI